MARAKKYERLDVVQKAVGVFQEKGYEAASLADLSEATGLNRKSLYHEFGSKAGLFAVALSHYMEGNQCKFGHLLIATPLGLNNIRQFIQAACDDGWQGGKGCLLTLSLNEENLLTPEHSQMLRANYRQMTEVLTANLEAAAVSDVSQKVNFIMSSLLGFTSFVRLAASQADFQAAVDQVIAVIDSWSVS